LTNFQKLKRNTQFSDGREGFRAKINMESLERLEQIVGYRIIKNFDIAFKELLDRYENNISEEK